MARVPRPYVARLGSDTLHWTMYLTLFGRASLLWSPALLTGTGRSDAHRYADALRILPVVIATAIQMDLLRALITFRAATSSRASRHHSLPAPRPF